jgi:hypothetical protein
VRFSSETLVVPWELSLWARVSIRAEAAWRITKGSPDVLVAIIDDGFDSSALLPTARFDVVHVRKSFVPGVERRGHGTCITQLILGSRCGYPGVAPECRVLGISLPYWRAAEEEAAAFRLALEADASIVCCAWGPTYSGPSISRAIPGSVSRALVDLAASRDGLGAVALIAAGNVGADARLDCYVSHKAFTAVGGITADGACYHNDSSEKVSLAAPVSNHFAPIGGPLGLPPGTSGAAALASGAAALVLAANPMLTAEQAVDILKNSTFSCPTSFVIDAHAAVLASLSTAPRPPSKVRQGTRHTLPPAARRVLRYREARFIGGEHSYLGKMGAMAAQHDFFGSETPEDAFFSTYFAGFNPIGMTPTYSSHVKQLLADFFDEPGEPALTIDGWSEKLEYGHLIGLAGDLFGTPVDLRAALREGIDSVREFIQEFEEQVDALFNNEDIWDLITVGGHAQLLSLLTRNWSHFAGDNLRFYLSYHLIAVNAASRCAVAASAVDSARHFQDALIAEGFAQHFLTDMFSSGHSRVTRWAFLQAHPHGQADMLSNLLHEHEGLLGVALTNARGQVWVAYGDRQLLASSTVGTIGIPNIDPYVHSVDPLALSYRFPDISTTGAPARFLAGELVFASLVDVFRNMAAGFQPYMSALGPAANPRGLLGYVLDRLPYAVTSSSLQNEQLRIAIENAFGIDPATLSLTARTLNLDALFDTYKNVVHFMVKSLAAPIALDLAAFRAKYEQHLTPEKVLSLARFQVGHLLDIDTLPVFADPVRIVRSVPNIIGQTRGRVGRTFTTEYSAPAGLILPSQWKDAVPSLLMGALADPEAGAWGISCCHE